MVAQLDRDIGRRHPVGIVLGRDPSGQPQGGAFAREVELLHRLAHQRQERPLPRVVQSMAGRDETVRQLAGCQDAEAGDDREIRCQPQAPAGGGPVALRRKPAQMRDDGRLPRRGRVVVPPRPFGGVQRVLDHADRVAQHRQAAGPGAGRGDIALAQPGQDGGPAVGGMQRRDETLPVALPVGPPERVAGQEGIVQRRHPWLLRQQAPILEVVEIGIAELVEHPVEAFPQVPEGAGIQHRKGAPQPLVLGQAALADQGDVVMARQGRGELTRIVGDAGRLRRQGRDQGEARQAPPGHEMGGTVPETRGFQQGLQRRPAACRGIRPAEACRLGRGMGQELCAESGLRQGARHQPGDIRRITRVEQRLLQSDHFRQAAGAAADRRGAAGHGLQHRQAETLVEGRKHRKVAGRVERRQVRLRHEADQHRFLRPEAGRLAGQGEFRGVRGADDHQLVPGPQRRRQQRLGPQQPGLVLARVAAADKEHEAVAQPVAGEQRLLPRCVHSLRAEDRAVPGADIDHPVAGQGEMLHGVLPAGLGDGEQQVGLGHLVQAAEVPVLQPLRPRPGAIEIVLPLDQRDQVVADRRRGRPCPVGRPARDHVVG
ncbi:hypothetical protein ROTAS13_03290 [Roseomonas sp. TAS13]|nr:hypothetical protein ROTAS13_03290 [Roseomonas sp. TAS13]